MSKTKENLQTKENPNQPPKGKISGSCQKRTISLFIMFSVTFLIFFLGHFYCILFVFAVQIAIFHEILTLKKNKLQNTPIQVHNKLTWFFFILCVILFNSGNLEHLFTNDDNNLFTNFLKYKQLIIFLLYMIGFSIFVAKLRKPYIKKQLSLFFWTHLLLIIVAFASLIIGLIYDGIIWFLTPIIIVHFNDIFAYIIGKLFGRHKLISISPNKTIEGYIGGMLGSMFGGWLIVKLTQEKFMNSFLCIQNEFNIIPFSMPNCEMPYVFRVRELYVFGFSNFFGKIETSEFAVHMVFFVLFASLIAPFGGFFASALKRSMKIKDFANLIPGHGGVLDRIDCLLIMFFFLCIYLRQIIKGNMTTLSGVLHYIERINEHDQLYLYNKLGEILKATNQITG